MTSKSKPVLMLVGGTWCYGVRDHVNYLLLCFCTDPVVAIKLYTLGLRFCIFFCCCRLIINCHCYRDKCLNGGPFTTVKWKCLVPRINTVLINILEWWFTFSHCCKMSLWRLGTQLIYYGKCTWNLPLWDFYRNECSKHCCQTSPHNGYYAYNLLIKFFVFHSIERVGYTGEHNKDVKIV